MITKIGTIRNIPQRPNWCRWLLYAVHTDL